MNVEMTTVTVSRSRLYAQTPPKSKVSLQLVGISISKRIPVEHYTIPPDRGTLLLYCS